MSINEKMNQAKIDAAIINPLRARFTAPRGLDANYLIATIYRDLARFDEPTLKEAFERVRRARPDRAFWPYPEEFESVAKAVEAEKAEGIEPGEDGAKIKKTQFERMRALRDEFMAGPVGQEACRDGWSRELALWFENGVFSAYKNPRPPADHEIAKMRSSRTRHASTMKSLEADLARSPDAYNTPFLKAAIQIGRDIEDQESTYQARYSNFRTRHEPATPPTPDDTLIPY